MSSDRGIDREPEQPMASMAGHPHWTRRKSLVVASCFAATLAAIATWRTASASPPAAWIGRSIIAGVLGLTAGARADAPPTRPAAAASSASARPSVPAASAAPPAIAKELADLRSAYELLAQRTQDTDQRVPPGTRGSLFLESVSHPSAGRAIDVDDAVAVRRWMNAAAAAFDSAAFDRLLLGFQARGRITRLSPADEEQRARHFEAAVCALMSLQSGAPVGTRLENLRAVENWIWNSHRTYYSLFLNAVTIWGRERQVRAHDPRSTLTAHVDALKRHRHDGKTAVDYRQDTSLHAVFRVAFPELSAAMDRIEAVAARRSP